MNAVPGEYLSQVAKVHNAVDLFSALVPAPITGTSLQAEAAHLVMLIYAFA